MTGHREKLEKGAVYHGQWMMTVSSDLARASSALGFDYVCIDMQHGFARASEILRLSDAIRAGGNSMVVARVPANRFADIGMLADAGVEAIIVPLVSNQEQAEQAVQAVTYPDQDGNRSWGPTAEIVLSKPIATAEIVKPLLFVMVENAEGYTNVDEICAVDGVDGVYVGPADLALAVGSVPGPEAPETTEAIERILRATKNAGKIPGTHCMNGKQAYQRREQGFQFITTSSDIGAAIAGYKADLQIGRGAE